MGDWKQVSEHAAGGGQPTPETLKQLAEQGFKSVVNLRSPGESGFLEEEGQAAKTAGLDYAHIPLNSAEASAEAIAQVLAEVEHLPQPVFFHCGAGARGGALALITHATQQGWSREQVIEKANELHISLEQPHLKQFLNDQS